MQVEAIEDPADPRLDDYRAVRDREWLVRRGLFVAEGRRLIELLLGPGGPLPRSVLLTPLSLQALGPALAAAPRSPSVYVAPAPLLRAVGGYEFHQGALAAAPLPALPTVSELLARVNDDSRARSLVVALDEVTNPENVGGVLRNAFAFGARCALLSVGCAHPLYRKALRTSMGAALQVPFTITRHWPAALAELGRAGYARVALSPAPDARDLAEVAAELHACPRVALVVGREGDGLSAATLAGCELRARIPMAPGVDSLNVATASGIAMHRLAGL